MSLVYPSFLWALLALTIPLIIHLFNFRKTTRIYFSNTRFLKQVKEETTQKRKLKQYLVLASRLLFLFFLVLAFAQPFLPAQDEMTPQQSIAIYLDNSLSMASPVSEKTRALDEAIQRAQGIVEVFPPSTKFQFITNDFLPASTSFKAKTEIADLLSQVKLSAVGRNSSEILARIKEKRTTLFWISDFQKSTFGEGGKPDSLTQIRLVPLVLENYANVFVDSVFLDNPFAIGGEKNTLRVRLRNSGKKSVEGLAVKLSLNGVQAAATLVNIGPDSFTEVPFDIASGLKGNNRAKVTFSDYPISFDNEFFFTLNYTRKLNVVEIKSTALPTFIEKVFGNKAIFTFKSFATSNVDYSFLTNADLVVLNGIDRIDEALSSAIDLYKKSFGAIMVVPGAHAEIASYQKFLALPITKSVQSEPTELDKPDLQNPFFANVVEDKNLPIAMPHATALLDWGIDRSAILKFKTNKPFLSQFNKIFVLACPLEKTFTDFFNHALFVPVMYRIAASGKKTEQALYYPLSLSTIMLLSDSITWEEPVKLIGDQEFVPSQRKTNGHLLLTLPKNAVLAGFYTVVNKKDTIGLVAFDADKKESMLQQMTGEEARAVLGGRHISVFNAKTSARFGREIKERYLGTPLWKYAIVLALTFLLAEILLIRFLK